MQVEGQISAFMGHFGEIKEDMNQWLDELFTDESKAEQMKFLNPTVGKDFKGLNGFYE